MAQLQGANCAELFMFRGRFGAIWRLVSVGAKQCMMINKAAPLSRAAKPRAALRQHFHERTFTWVDHPTSRPSHTSGTLVNRKLASIALGVA